MKFEDLTPAGASEHSSMLGNAPAHELFDLIKTQPLGTDAAPRNFADDKPNISIDASAVSLASTKWSKSGEHHDDRFRRRLVDDSLAGRLAVLRAAVCVAAD
jgi:hypothetical protein